LNSLKKLLINARVQFEFWIFFRFFSNIADSNSCNLSLSNCSKGKFEIWSCREFHIDPVFYRRWSRACALPGLQLGIEISLEPPRDRSHYSATFLLDVISLDLSAKLLANSQHRIITGRIPSKLNGRNRISKSAYAISQLRDFEL